jgi:hypothetical protein
MKPREYVAVLDVSREGDPPDWEGQVTVKFKFQPGRPYTPPAYDHGGLPPDDPEIYDVTCILIDGRTPSKEDAEQIENEVMCNEGLMQHLMEEVE